MGFHRLTNFRREGKTRKKRKSLNGNEDAENVYSISNSDESENDDDRPKYLVLEHNSLSRRRPKKRQSGKSDDFRTGIPYPLLTSNLTIVTSKDDEGRRENLEPTMSNQRILSKTRTSPSLN